MSCKPNEPLIDGTTLVIPEKVTVVPDATMRSMNPDVRMRAATGPWKPAATGMPLYSNSNVNTLEAGRADLEFSDRTRVTLAPNSLAVIYGSANQTRVSKTPPVAVEVSEGEVKAGLAVLRGRKVEIAVNGGGRVSAASRDTVIQKKGDRATVSVFDGKADVKAGGQSVSVPKNFGTRFVGDTAPLPPRPLPPAPAWAAGGTEGIALAPGGMGGFSVSWEPVPSATAYRIEVARDDNFNDLVARTEAPADQRLFRAEKMPAATYHIRVRAIDKEEYLGIASADRVIKLIHAAVSVGSGTVKPREVEVNPYGALRLMPLQEMEMALDDGPFEPMYEAVDLPKLAPSNIRLRLRGTTVVDSIAIKYTKVEPKITATPSADAKSLDIRVSLAGLDGIDVPNRVAPAVRIRPIREGTAVISQPLTAGADGSFAAVVPLSGTKERLRVDVIDNRGRVLGSAEVEDGKAVMKPVEAPPPPPPAAPPLLGAAAPLFQVSSATDVLWFAPTAQNAASLGGGVALAPGGLEGVGQFAASGAVGPLGVDAAVRVNTTSTDTRDASAWLGARYRVLRLDDIPFELAPAVRVGIPVVTPGTGGQLEFALAAGAAAGSLTFVGDIGGRFRLSETDPQSKGGAPRGQGFLLLGGTVDLLSWLRVHALADAHIVGPDQGSLKFVAGLGAGLEAGKTIFGALGVHASPWVEDSREYFTAQLAIGIREFR